MSVSMIRNATPSQASEKSRFSGKLRGAGLVTLAALTIAGTSMIATAPALADHWHHHDRGGAVAAGVIGGLALGAIAGSAIAQPGPTVIYEDDYPVEYRRVYRPRRDLPSCSNFRRVDWDARVWIDDYGRAHPCY
ncbi:MAG: hypothetical protein ACTHJQ_26120 [Rhizobiaceae bacterium]